MKRRDTKGINKYKYKKIIVIPSNAFELLGDLDKGNIVKIAQSYLKQYENYFNKRDNYC